IPTPRPMSRQFARCLGVARRRRGNQASGAETRRPSTSVTISSSSVHLTSTASATGLLAKVLIPSNDKLVAMFFNERIKLSEFCAGEAASLDHFDRFKPKFRVALRLLHMDVARFVTFTTKEEKAISANAQNFWHAAGILLEPCSRRQEFRR